MLAQMTGNFKIPGWLDVTKTEWSEDKDLTSVSRARFACRDCGNEWEAMEAGLCGNSTHEADKCALCDGKGNLISGVEHSFVRLVLLVWDEIRIFECGDCDV